ncbi:MAG: DMT family transporter [Lentisphaerae bacterium]|nr:DMT family transporter [Lentisphaerota bacterium]
MGIFFAFCCLACSALNDFLFKIFSGKKSSVGIFVSIVGVIWLAALCTIPVDLKNNLPATILWSIIGGTFSLTGNLLLIESMKFQSAGVCSTIYRLNLVAVVLGANLLLGENLSLQQYLGVAAAAAAVFCFFSFEKNDSKKALLGLGLAIAASLLRAGMGLSYKYGIMQGADANGISIGTSFFWIFGGIIYCLIRKEPIRASFNKYMLITGIVSGVFVAGIVFFMASALKYGDASVVLTIAQMSFLGTLALSVIFLKEKLSPLKITGMLCGIASIFLLTLFSK